VKHCLGCGELTEGSRCASCALPRTRPPGRSEHYNDNRWRTLSMRLRKQSPFCEQCGSTDRLSVDHIIPVSEAPELRLEPLNCRVLCLSYNASRRNNCTDEERAAVLAAISQRRRRPSAI